ncbi:hypothetical protein ACLB2K_053737 [Fragaria x ananassa]
MSALGLKCGRPSVLHRPAPATARLDSSSLPDHFPSPASLFFSSFPTRSPKFEVLGDLAGNWKRTDSPVRESGRGGCWSLLGWRHATAGAGRRTEGRPHFKDCADRRSQAVCIPTVNSLERPDDQKSDNVPEYCIDAGSNGNIARFINHSCEPNLFVQCVLSSHHDIKLARVVLFAADNIPPLQELTYDYGYALDSVLGPDGKVKKMFCHCGAVGCKKRLF